MKKELKRKFSKKVFEAIKANRKVWRKIKRRKAEGFVDIKTMHR